MTPDDSDKRLREKIEKAFVPADLSPTEPEDIEAMLDAAGGEPFSEEKVERMMKKLKGELPLGPSDDENEDPVWDEGTLNEEEEALLALHRNGAGQLPPAIEEKLRKLREEAKRQPETGESGDE